MGTGDWKGAESARFTRAAERDLDALAAGDPGAHDAVMAAIDAIVAVPAQLPLLPARIFQSSSGHALAFAICGEHLIVVAPDVRPPAVVRVVRRPR